MEAAEEEMVLGAAGVGPRGGARQANPECPLGPSVELTDLN